MRVGIVGPAERTHAWEKHLRPHHSVSEVIIAAKLAKIGDMDACFLLDDTGQALSRLLQAVKQGYHTFFISQLPTDRKWAERLFHASQEANTRVQFSHWATLAPASRWMRQQLKTPSFMQLNQSITHNYFSENNLNFKNLWVDNLAYCLKYVGSPIHHFDINAGILNSGTPYTLHISLRFKNGTTAFLFLSVCAQINTHTRIVSDKNLILNCDVKNQTVHYGRENNKHFYQKRKSFDATLTAENAISQFLKAIQLGKSSAYNPHDLWQLSEVVEQIEKRIQH